MKTIDAQSAVPTMFNSFVEYSGTLANTGSLSDGTSIEVPITTEIRQDLHVDAMCRENDVLVPRIFQAFWKKSLGASNVAVVTIEVPSGCTCVYRISGNKELTQPLHKEQGSGVRTVGNQHAGGHRHDGNDSKQIAYSSITGTPEIPVLPTLRQMLCWQSPAGAYGYVEPFGQEGVVIGFKGTSVVCFITYNDGTGYQRTSVAYTSLSVVPGDRVSLRWWDDGGTDRTSFYKNNTLVAHVGADLGVATPTSVVLMFTELTSLACVPSATDLYQLGAGQNHLNPITIQFRATYTSTSSHAEVSTDSGFGGINWEGNGTTTGATIPGGTLSAATTYYYRVYMVNANGNSEYSETLSFTTA